MTPDHGWLALVVPVLAFTLPMLAGAFVLESLIPWLRGERECEAGCRCRGERG